MIFFVIKINMTSLWSDVGAQVFKAIQSHQIWLADGNQRLSEVNSISTWADVCHVEMSIIVELWHFQSYNEMPIKNMLLINDTPVQACFADCDCHKRMIKMKPSHHLSCVTFKVKSQGHADHICQPCAQNFDTNEAYQSFERKKNCTPHHKVKRHFHLN